jgi:hypothetical protein
MNAIRFLLASLFLSAPVAWADEFVDDFADAKLEGRLAERGEWKFASGIASCVADPELYEQFKNHGPILKWPREFNDATIEFEMKPTDCQRVVFTLNGEGHIFRVTLANETHDAPAGTSKVPKERTSRRVQPDQTKAEYGYFQQKNIAVNSTEKVPLVISLHGAGGGKKGVDGVPLRGEKFFAASKHSYLFVKPVSKKGWDPDKLDQFIDTMLEENKDIVDPKRIYLYGYSMGGHGSWRYCIDHGDRIAAMIAIEGGFRRSEDLHSEYDFKHFVDLPV